MGRGFVLQKEKMPTGENFLSNMASNTYLILFYIEMEE